MTGCPPYNVDLRHVADIDGRWLGPIALFRDVRRLILSPIAIDLIHGLLAHAPAFRLTIRAALAGPWIARNRSELDVLYARNVRVRQTNKPQFIQDAIGDAVH